MDKPEAAKLGWKVLESGVPYENPWIRLRSDRLKAPGRGEFPYTYVQHPGGVLVVPRTDSGDLLLIRQYRYPVDQWCLEVPAGGMHGESDAAVVARKELREEVGASCRELRQVGRFFVSNSLMDEVCRVFLALGCRRDQPQRLEVPEFIEVVATPLEEALEMARDGRVQDGKSALALLMAEKALRGGG